MTILISNTMLFKDIAAAPFRIPLGFSTFKRLVTIDKEKAMVIFGGVSLNDISFVDVNNLSS